ncbi:TetR/AcrR family transcriptional regulator [Streptosporangium sp. NPDC051022]|uniref:TetR/AcrR family transcriptional regulator n=1 Tax=Streptosporangium sp. NPDC051022 TaxID=3155752 RepID=UPI00341D2470
MTQPAHRRRGEDLEQAIFQATLDELAEVGYANLQMERVAARAKAGKASLYKRWPSRAHLVRATTRHLATTLAPDIPLTGETRDDLVTVLKRIADHLAGPYGEAVRGLIAEWPTRVPGDETEQARLPAAQVRVVAEILETGVERGRLRPQALTPRIVNLGPMLVTYHYLSHGEPAPIEVIEEIVDTILMPILAGRPAAEQGPHTPPTP